MKNKTASEILVRCFFFLIFLFSRSNMCTYHIKLVPYSKMLVTVLPDVILRDGEILHYQLSSISSDRINSYNRTVRRTFYTLNKVNTKFYRYVKIINIIWRRLASSSSWSLFGKDNWTRVCINKDSRRFHTSRSNSSMNRESLQYLCCEDTCSTRKREGLKHR